MTTPQLIKWLDAKMAEFGNGKLIPPPAVLEQELAKQIQREVREEITERILREARVDEQVAAAIAAIKKPDGAELARETALLFRRQPEAEWRDHIKTIARRRRD